MRDEDFLRLEHKIDIVISALQANNLCLNHPDLPQLFESNKDICPVCGRDIKFKIYRGLRGETEVVRECGCRPPVRSVQPVQLPDDSVKSMITSMKKDIRDGTSSQTRET